MKPITENVVVKCNEKLLWGEMEDASNHYNHGDAKGGFFDDADAFEDGAIQGSRNLWDD